MRDSRSSPEDWQALVRATRSCPMFDTWRQVRTNSDVVTIVPGWKRPLLAPLFLAAGIALGIVGYRFAPQFEGFGLYLQFLCAIFAMGLIALGLGIWGWRTTIAWRRGDGTIEIDFRRAIHRRRINLAAEDLAVELVLFGALDANRYTQTGVRLRLRGADDPPPPPSCFPAGIRGRVLSSNCSPWWCPIQSIRLASLE